MITVYIASPYTEGDTAINVRSSFQAADTLVANGFAPYTPLYSHFWHFLSPKSYETWMRLDLEWIMRCDCVLRLPGKSKGADKEVKFAKENGIPVFSAIWEIQEYFKDIKNVNS